MKIIVGVLEIVFIIGAIGCCITIPVAAWGYFSVLLEKDRPEELRAEEGAEPHHA